MSKIYKIPSNPDDSDHPGFEPDSAVKNFMLYERKLKRNWNNFKINEKFPGFFDTYGWRVVIIGFICAVIIEVVTIFFLHSYVQPLILLCLPFILDLVFAFLGTWPKKKITLLENERILILGDLRNDDKSEKPLSKKGLLKKNKNQLRRYKYLSLLCHFFIILAFGIKAIWIMQNLPAVGQTKVMLLLGNALVMVIHVLFSGNFLWGTVFRMFFLRRQTRTYTDQKKSDFHIQNYRKDHIPGTDLNEYLPTAKDIIKHRIISENGDQYLFTWGILHDEELNSLIELQGTPHQKEKLALYGLNAQFKILESDTNETKVVKNLTGDKNYSE